MVGRPLRGDRPFVGRDHELGLIADARAHARDGIGSLIVIRGEPGIGKSTLCELAAERAGRDGFVVGWGRCWSDGGSPPLWPWPEVLAELGGPDASGLLAGEAGRPGLDADRFARFTAVGELLAGQARSTPLMIVVDDAHAADTAALLLARFLVRVLDRSPLVMLLACRSQGDPERPESGRLLDELEREATVIHLGSFDRHDTAAFLDAHGMHVEEYGLIPALSRLTDGNPLLLTRAVANAAPSNVLAGIERVIDDVLGVLSPDHRDVMAVAAILGMEATATDVAAVAGREFGDVLEALTSASSAGLMDDGPGGWVFTHDLVRRAALDVLTPLETIEVHARALAVAPNDDRPAAVTRRAHHALVAAARSDADAARAIAECRAAARVLARGFDYERASALLESASTLAERQQAPARRAEVLLEWADALQVCGRLADARRVYERGAAAAERAAEPLARARAALGLGGFWLDEHRDQVDRERVLGVQRSALDGLPAHAKGLRARLTVRLAAEAVYDGAAIEPVLDALAAARQLGDPRVLAEALSNSHHAMLAPEHLDDRRSLAEELIRVASAAGDDLRVLSGLLWKVVNMFHAGDRRAPRVLDELRRRTDAIGCRSISYIVAAIDVMQLIRDGRLDDAEVVAHECFEFGVDVGDADATGYYGAHLLTIRWLQDRDGELLDLARSISTSSTLVVPEFAFAAATAGIAARAGCIDEAAASLRVLCADGLDALPRSSTWLSGIVNITEAAWTIGDAGVAREAYRLLEPFAARPAMPSLAVSCSGLVERALGLAALTFADAALAVDHLSRAVTGNIDLGNRPMTVIARADLATALVVRDRPGDRALAIIEFRRAAVAAVEIGMGARAEAWRRRAAELSDVGDRDDVVLRRDGSRWVVDLDDRQVTVPDLVGVGYLGDLLANPGHEIAALELCGGSAVEGAHHELIDRQALAAYRRRVNEIDALLETAHRAGRGTPVLGLNEEREALRAELSSVLAPSGRSRRFTDSEERARTAVRKAITRAIDVIAAADDGLGSELRATVTTGRSCTYVPDPAHHRRWSVVVDS